MFLSKSQKFNLPKFYYDGARILYSQTLFYFNKLNGGYIGNQQDKDIADLKYVLVEQLKDVENIQILKEELGTDFIEKQMYKQFKRNNNAVEDEIKNKFQRNLFYDLQKQNNFLVSMFKYFFHKFYYDDENLDEMNKIENFKNVGAIIGTYKTLKTNGLPSAKIIEEIKAIYPSLHNLFVKLLQIKFGEIANITIMNIQDAQQALKEAEITEQIQKIKVKKPSKLELAKK